MSARRKTSKRKTKNSPLLYNLLAFVAGVGVGVQMLGK